MRLVCNMGWRNHWSFENESGVRYPEVLNDFFSMKLQATSYIHVSLNRGLKENNQSLLLF